MSTNPKDRALVVAINRMRIYSVVFNTHALDKDIQSCVDALDSVDGLITDELIRDLQRNIIGSSTGLALVPRHIPEKLSAGPLSPAWILDTISSFADPNTVEGFDFCFTADQLIKGVGKLFQKRDAYLKRLDTLRE